MSGQGIQVTAFSTLQDLRKRLADNYPISSIVKELLQNAEDACSKTAGAGRLDFAWVAALPGAEHPLLKGPGLVVVNDGELTAADCDALSSYGINHKAGDRSTIGRFGLGLKSVFNLGEAFFYASSTPDARNPGGHLDEVVSPWFGTGCHEDWRDFSRTDDRTRLREFLAPLLTGEHWFCLWVPLRRQAPDGEPDPIRGTFPGDEVACPAEHLSDKTALFVAGVLPLLRHLHTVRGWCHWAGPDSVAAPTFTVAVEPGGARGLFPDANELTQPRTGGGTVTVCLASGAESWPYAVAQAWRPDLATLRRDPNWPKTLTLTSGSKSVKEKAEPHAAVSVVYRPGPTPSLSIRNAVFLPLSADGDTATAGASPGEVTVLLHGCVFVDSGRGEAKAGVDPLRDEWNRRLTAEGTRPRLIPALAQLCRDVPTVAAALTASLAAHPAVTPHLADFCGARRWLYRWSPAVTAGYAVAPAAGNFYELPHFGDDATLPTRALPRLAEFRRLVVAVAGRPRLSATGPSLWPDDALAELLAIKFPASLAAMEYLAMFVRSQQPLGVQAVAALTATLRDVYSVATTKELRDNADALGRLTAGLPDDTRLGLSFNHWGDRGCRPTWLVRSAGPKSCC